ncbi:family 78 glycoside hydrolase catalytic domain [Microbacterium allomyrinae]|uniref:alpha-L-rhamnosidase n=1 Tax=Microbacterium allomyrinae TaxID=2830666 RepID=A0A9X1LST9_9MICO|nr:family 78 glycoside hydrolase catalytic domain [Microbacterium allomyrinae]MCC2031507.1 family 78 glycoside hydrolase catalytic domain [Microbacterium allomyrinae]
MTLQNDPRTDASAGVHAGAPTPFGLLIDGRAHRGEGESRGVDVAIRSHPRLSWRVDESRTAYEVEVADEDGDRVWSTGRVESSGTSVTVDTTLSPRQRYLVAVRLQGGDGRWSPWVRSEFETGPSTLADWQAEWISVPARSRLRRSFELRKPVQRGRLYLTGQGLVRSEINGEAVNAGHLDPTRTDAGRALYRCYDVGDILAAGHNDLDLVVAMGEWSRTGLEPRVLAELVIWHPDGTRTTIVPDTEAVVSASRVTLEDPFYVERHDAAVEADPCWVPLAPSARLAPADESDDPALPPSVVEPDPTPPAHVVSRVPLVEIGRSAGIRLYDAGTNIAGRSRIEVLGALPRGTRVRSIHGEHVGADGRLDTTNLMMPFDDGRERQVVEWLATGEPGDVVEAWFAYHGFRYVEVQGLPDDADVHATAGILHTDLERSGRITTGSPTIERLLERAERTLLNNVHGVPEDCPTREQSAWTGDTASVAEYELAAFDTENFFAKWIRDLLTSQAADGGLPAIAPDVRSPRLPADPVWGAALHRVLLGHWLHYGDELLVREALPGLRRWAAFQLSCADDTGVIARSPISYGHDWLALEQTPPEVHHTAAAIDCLLALSRLEAEVGDAAASATWWEHVERLRAAARARFHDPDRGVFANGSQGAYAAAIDAGILTGADAEQAAERIEQDVRARGNRISGGFATTRTIVRALTATGRSQVVADMLEQPAEPGIGAMLASGPGTFWECWWIDPTNTGTGSLDHVGLGGVFAGWVWHALAGLAPTSAGYRTFAVAPQFVAGLDDLHLQTQTPLGTIRIAYRIVDDVATIELDVPVGSLATVVLPGTATREVAAGRHEFRVAALRREIFVPGADSEKWTAPSIAPRAGDVTGSRGLLAEALSDGTLHAQGLGALQTMAGLNCMPIPHAQPAGAVVEVTSGRAVDPPIARIEFLHPLDASDATFLYALVDLCDDRWSRGSRPTIRLIASDGSQLLAAGTSWPAGWNRVAVDVEEWQGRSSIAALEVSLLPPGDAAEDHVMPQGAGESPGGFHLGEIGISQAHRTW